MALTQVPAAIVVDEPDSLPAEVGTALLTMANAAVPIGLVAQLSRDLSAALGGHPLVDADVVVLAWGLSRTGGTWALSMRRFRQLRAEIEALLDRAGCTRPAITAVVADLEHAYRLREPTPAPAIAIEKRACCLP